MKNNRRVLLLVDWIPEKDSVLVKSLQKADLNCDVMGIHFHQSKWTPVNKIFIHWPRCFWTSLKAFKKRYNYSYILAWSQTMGTFLGLIKLAMRSDYPQIFILETIIVERHNFIIERLRRWFISISWKKVNYIGFMSRTYLQLVQKRYRIPESKCIYLKLPLFIEEHNIPSMAKSGDYMYSVGRSYRDYRTLMAVAINSKHHFVVVTSDDALTGLRIPDNVTIYRNVFGREIDRLLYESAGVIIPLDRTTSPAGELTLTEAMFCGKPVIITETLITQEYIIHGQNGFLVPEKNPNAILEAVDFIFSNPEKAADIGRMAKQSVVTNHAIDVFARNIANVIFSVFVFWVSSILFEACMNL